MMKKLLPALLLCLPLVTVAEPVRQINNQRDMCQAILQGGAFNLYLEKTCGFNGGVSRKLAQIGAANVRTSSLTERPLPCRKKPYIKARCALKASTKANSALPTARATTPPADWRTIFSNATHKPTAAKSSLHPVPQSAGCFL